MLLTILVLVLLAVTGVLIASQPAPNTRVDIGRAILWGAIIALVWVVANQVPPLVR